MSKVALPLTTLAAVGLGLICFHLARELRTERAQVQALQVRLDELEREPIAERARRAARPTQRPDEAALSAAPATPAVIPAQADPPISNAHPPSRPERMQQFMAGMQRQRELLRDPSYRDAVRTQQKMMLARSHPDLAEEMGFAGDDMDRFLALLAEQQLRRMEEPPAVWNEGPPDPATVAERMRQTQERQQADEAEIANLMGHSTLQAWKDYQSTRGARQQVNQLRGMLASKGMPLQDTMAKSLITALADVQHSYAQETNQPTTRLLAHGTGRLQASTLATSSASAVAAPANPIRLQESRVERMKQYQQRVHDAVSALLTPEQLRIFEEDQQSQLALMEAQRRLVQAQADAAARDGNGEPGLIVRPSFATGGFVGQAALAEGVLVTPE
jgi:hypothetical protein